MSVHKYIRKRRERSSAMEQIVQVMSRRDSEPNFRKILPSAVQKMVEQGLFVEDPGADGGYRITEKGRAVLAELEKGELK
jgi:uncharacterized protein with ATP-grasp and redox domains